MRSRAATTVLGAAVAAGVVAMGGCSGLEKGPATPSTPKIGANIAVPGEHGGALVVPVNDGFTDGLEVLRVVGDRPVVIRSVSISSESDGLEFVGASLSFQPGGTIAYQFDSDYPPPGRQFGRVVPAVGATIAPLAPGGHPPELLVGMRVSHPGIFFRSDVIIDYQVDDGPTLRAIFPARLTLCTADVTTASEECLKRADQNPGAL